MKFDLRSPAIAAGVALALALPAIAEKPTTPTSKPFFAWSLLEQPQTFPALERAYPNATIVRSATPRPLPTSAAQLSPLVNFAGRTSPLADFMRAHRIQGVVALKNGEIVLERYSAAVAPNTRWPSTGIAQALTSTLVGAAIKDGWVRSEYDTVKYYVPELAKTPLADVSLRRLMAMSSGVRWSENYNDPASDVRKLLAAPYKPGGDNPLVTIARQLAIEAEPGTKHVAKSFDADLVGLSLSRALAGKSLAQYASEKVWGPAGMESDALWVLDAAGQEKASGPVSLTLRDAARFGQFVLEGGRSMDKTYLPADWIAKATSNQLNAASGQGAGMLWTLKDEGAFEADGLYGQALYVDPTSNMVIVVASVADEPVDREQNAARDAVIKAVRDAAGGNKPT
jgi:CubicO group peptidase (beta-lactamase class C family)